MFCCTKSGHDGEIITSLCQELNCQASFESQLLCSECMRGAHQSHTHISMRNILPELLMANNEKKYYQALVDRLVTFINDEFSQDTFVKSITSGTKIQHSNVVAVVQAVLMEYRKVNKEENRKLRDIERTLKINSEAEKSASPGRSNLLPNYQSVLIKPTSNLDFGKQSKIYESVPLSISQISGIETFSHTLKHAYVTVSHDLRSVVKSSQGNGYKVAALSSYPIPIDAESICFNLRVVKSSGNILLGLGIPEIVKEREYLNCYGAGQGTYLLGQNGNDPISSILFHHSDAIYNRKEIVGWNYKEAEILGVGVMRQDENDLVVFRKYQTSSNGKPDLNKISKQFTMPIWSHNMRRSPLHIIAILQNLGDHVEILPTQQ